MGSLSDYVGSAARKNIGTTNGTVPLIGAGDKLPASVLPSSSALLARVIDEKTSGTMGGASSSSWATRDLNTVDFDPQSVITLSSNEFTPSVDCGVTWSTPAYEGQKIASRLVRVSSGAVIAESTSEASYASASIRTMGAARITSGVAYRIEQRVASAKATNGLGTANGFGSPEVYTEVLFWS